MADGAAPRSGLLTVGDPFPTFRTPGTTNPNYVLDSAAGRYLVLAVLSAADPERTLEAMALADQHRSQFDDISFCFFGLLSAGPPWQGQVADRLPGVRWLFDASNIAASLGVLAGEICWILIDPTMRVLATSDAAGAPGLLRQIAKLPPPPLHGGGPSTAPVLLVPRVFEPSFCHQLVGYYDTMGGQPSGFMREIDGVTRLVKDLGHKRRSDVVMQDETLIQGARTRIARRLAPEILKVFQYDATRIERYLVSRYDAETGGYFRPHRDNTTKGTAHRRFAVSLNLNADFDGGDLRFPEFGQQTFRPTLGGAVVFSCSLLHEATPVTRGQRYAFLPFLYDEKGARTREQNLKYVEATA